MTNIYENYPSLTNTDEIFQDLYTCPNLYKLGIFPIEHFYSLWKFFRQIKKKGPTFLGLLGTFFAWEFFQLSISIAFGNFSVK